MPPRNVDFIPAAGPGAQDEPGVSVPDAPLLRAQRRHPGALVWRNIIWMIILHVSSIYGVYCLATSQWRTMAWWVVSYTFGALGITAGAHRLWAHKTYKAKTPLRVFLAFCNSMAFQNDIIEWSRDHRVHHRHSETDADPHNATRGFFFAHIGWLFVRKHPEVREKGKLIDISDLLADPVCQIQRRFYFPSVILMCFIFPAWVPWYFWGESFWSAYFSCALLRYCASLNATWCVNSLAHLYGNKPYDDTISPVENFLVTFSAIGEGFHNYHHTFPHDYSASEFGWKVNPTTCFIDLMGMIGQAYDRKKVPRDLVRRRQQRTGDGSTGFGMLDGDKHSWGTVEKQH